MLNSNTSNIDSKSKAELDSVIMKKIAEEFYKKFKDTPIPVKKISTYFNYYSSVVILFKDGSGFAIPYYFYQQTQANPQLDYSFLFQKEYNWLDLLSNIFDFTSKITIKLSQADIKILKAITQYKRSGLFKKLDYSSRSNVLIHIKNLGNITGLSEKWVAERFHFMVKNYILFPQYILNPFIFGLNTFLLVYNRKYDQELSLIDELTLFNLNLEYNTVIRIVQFPNIESTDDLSFSFPVEIKRIYEMHIYINLSGLSSKLAENYKRIPNFDTFKAPIIKETIDFKQESVQWMKLLEFNDEDENKYPFLKKMSYSKRVSAALRLLNYLAKWGIIQANFSKAAQELRITVFELMETFRFLLDNDMIAFFPRINRIGIHNRYGLLIIDQEEKNEKTLQNLYYNLLELPLSVCFIGSNFIFAYINIPDIYITPFFRYITQIQNIVEVKYSMFISLKSWGRFSIPLPEGTTVDEFGVNFPYSVFSKLKSKATNS